MMMPMCFVGVVVFVGLYVVATNTGTVGWIRMSWNASAILKVELAGWI